MASDYGLNFGFRRSDESVVVREGRLKVPTTGTFRLGSLVTFDAAAPGFLALCADGDVGEGGTVGLLVQEEIWERSLYAPTHIDSFYYGIARNNRLAVIVSGPGAKVWFKNTAAQTRADGRSIAAVAVIDAASTPAVLDYLTWDQSSAWFTTTGATAANSMLRVTATNGTDYVEAVLTR